MITKHPLFWKEWKNSKWWSVLITGIFLVMFLAINSKLENIQRLINDVDINSNRLYLESITFFEGSFSNALLVATLFIIPIVVIISTLLFRNDRKGNIGEFMGALPFTKGEQFKIKWLVGFLTLTIPFLITSILTVLIRTANWKWISDFYQESRVVEHDSLLVIMLILFQAYLFIMAFFSFLLMIQSLYANNIGASIIGVISLFAPWFIVETGLVTLSRILNRDIRILGHERFTLFYSLMAPARDSIVVNNGRGYDIHMSIFASQYYWLKIAVLFLIIILSLYLGSKSYSKNENSKNGQLIMFEWARILLVIGFVICASLLGNTGIRVLFIRETNGIFEIITLLISGIAGYKLINKILSIPGGVKYD
ncbi:MAG: hypothetical protein GX366_05055 [Epulopiscium sp.]|nr:hypothetical protein [Candidatus Epulonipiscium sp.]